MNINRHNYESFFLLYADRELSAAERTEVELFVELNPDLTEEFLQAQELTLPADEIKIDKTALLKSEDHISALEEKMLLYIDGELDEKNSAELEAMLEDDAELKKTFNLFKKTKLDPADAGGFINKSLLYRKEKTPLISIRTLRWAAAAIFLGAGLFAGSRFLENGQKKINTEETAGGNLVKPGIVSPGKESKASMGQNTVKQSNPKNLLLEKNTGLLPGNDQNQSGNNNRKRGMLNNLSEENMLLNASLQQNTRKQKSIQHHQNTVSAGNGDAQKNGLVLSARPEQQQKLKTPEQEPEKELVLASNRKTIEDRNETLIPLQESFAKNTSLTEMETSSNDKILYMNEDNVNRSKTGIFFRKLKRVVERNAKLKPGRSLKIAGFEIAAR